MLTQVDEINKSRHLEANLTEFMEMLVRCAKVAAFPPTFKADAAGNFMESSMTMKERNNQTLTIKIENMILVLLENCCD